MTQAVAQPTERRDPERVLEQFFRHRVRLAGGYTIKLAPTEAGVPDRLVMFPGGRMYLVELKAIGGSLRPIQLAWHAKIGFLGTRVIVLTGRDEIVGWIRSVVKDMGLDD